MTGALQQESERLRRSWMQHDAEVLRDYLVADVEDPRLNLQSILSRHFLTRAVTEERFAPLMDEEYRFSAVMNWLILVAKRIADPEDSLAVLHALKHRADNAEGIEIPHHIVESFARLPATANGLVIGNYIEDLLSHTSFVNGRFSVAQPALDTFAELWRNALASWPSATQVPGSASSSPNPMLATVLEPACGSANDYRFLEAYGIARLIEYTGFDLCSKNVDNARTLFPGVRFHTGNVFEIDAPAKAFDLCYTHDLFEHLSFEGLEAAVKEICRVTRRGLCVGFFNMDEIPEHVVRPVEGYHWNTLSMARMKERFEAQGFTANVVHVGSFLRRTVGCPQTHNPRAYTFILRPA